MAHLLRIGEAADRLGFSKSTLRRAMGRGLIPYQTTPGGHALLHPADVEAYRLAHIPPIRRLENADA